MHKRILSDLRGLCAKDEFQGWDPYDGLNSKVLRFIPFSNKRFVRLVWIQFFKRSPINFRKLALVPKGYNPKALGLFLSAECRNYSRTNKKEHRENIDFLIGKILELKSPGYSGSCWGYNFDWQARAFFQPKGTPTVVATSFIANALLDAYEILKEEKLLNEARSACEFVLKDLNRTLGDNDTFCFSYSPMDSSQVYNASLLGSRILSRVYSYTKEKMLIDNACKSVEYCVNAQNEDGSWGYGTLPYHQWIDNFHTGYNLECISEYQKYSGDIRFEESIKRGLDYYTSTFFTKDGVPKYYNNSIYPIDIHAPAQLVLTLFRLGCINEYKSLVDKVLGWTVENMFDSKRGYFYFQKNKYYTIKIPYMRWSQAWMYYAISHYLYAFDE